MTPSPNRLRRHLMLLMLAAALPSALALLLLGIRQPDQALGVLPYTLLATALVLGMAWRKISDLTTALHPLISTVQRVTDGDLSARAQAQRPRGDEISKLAFEVDRMAEALARRDLALTEARDRAQAYLDVVGVMVLALNTKGNIVLANRKVCETLGCDQPQQCLGGNWFDKWIPLEGREQARARFDRDLDGAEPDMSHEAQIMTLSGQRRLIAWHVSPLNDRNGQRIGLLCAGHDITEMQRIQQDLLDSRNRFQTLVENIPGVVFRSIVDFPWRMEYISRAVEQISGIAAERFIDGSVRYGELIHPDDRAALQRSVSDSIERRQAYSCGYRLRRHDGAWGWMHEQGQAVLDDAGRPIWLDGVIIDITETKALQEEQQRLQAQLQQAQKMEALGQLTGGIAHDFNNILAAVLGFTKLALRRHVSDPNGELAEYLREVVAAGERARDMVARMLAFSRARPGRETKPLTPQPLVKEALKMLAATIPAGIGIETRYAADTPDVAIDPVDLHQILVNLVINARDAVGGHGKISVNLDRASVDQQVCNTCNEKFSGEFLRLTVTDNGQGMAAETLPHIFEPFFTTKPVGQGSGMGLSMVHGLVRRAGGHCQVESRVGLGSAFHIYLPAAKRPAAASPVVAPPTPAASHEARGHLLLVDDETPLLRLLHANLQADGWRVSCFASPRQALAVFRDAPSEFDAVVSDQSMPEMTGIELIGALHGLRPDLPAILCTGYGDDLDAATLRRQGIHSLLLKPLENDDLLAALDAAMTEKNPIQ